MLAQMLDQDSMTATFPSRNAAPSGGERAGLQVRLDQRSDLRRDFVDLSCIRNT
jgi:hypothetical protein